jgi:BirA family transcriptional regulator, biotin operon repressor / biotin---[acetyl-CoA-carboxylase] ligase
MSGSDPGLPPGFRVVVHPSLGSTNDEAGRLAREGADEGTIVQAIEQSAGRGRRGRGWSSPPGNVYCSTILRPRRPAVETALLSFATALSVAETVEGILGPAAEVRCKWPNDVLVGGAKITGILLESEPDVEGIADWVVIGTGINVRHHPEGTEFRATSLAARGAGEVAVEAVLNRYARRLAHWYEAWRIHGFGPLREAWLSRAAGLGQPLRARLADRTIDGLFAGLDTDGVLLLDRAGDRVRISAGDVFFPAP